jgi:hypothetical protein
MATADEIAALRGLINEPDENCEGWEDDRLAELIDGSGSLNSVAHTIWLSKASSYSTLVDVSESGSSRKLGDLYKNALAMAKMFKDLDDDDVEETTDAPVIARIRRGFA